jgi:uncharacterized protein
MTVSKIFISGFAGLGKKEKSTLRSKIVGLIQLQECDNKINKLESLIRDFPARIKKLEDDLNAGKAIFQTDSDILESLKKERRKTEQMTQELEGKIEKSKIKLSNIKSNKEYTAALKEIEDFDKERSNVEDSILRFMEDIDAAEKKCLINKDELARLQNTFDHDKKKIEKMLEELNKESDVLQQKRQELLSGIDKELLSRYEFLKVRKGGLAIGPVIGGVCQLCHLNIPPQNFYELIRGNELMSCPNCNRLVYWGEDEYYMKVLGRTSESSDNIE